jgi:hypothetical protein
VRRGNLASLTVWEISERFQSLSGPAYANAAGLLRQRLDEPALDDVDADYQPPLAQAAASVKNAVHDMWNWLRENF